MRTAALLSLWACFLTAGCGSESRTSTPIGGAWRIDRVLVTSWEQPHARIELRRDRDLVDEFIYEDRHTFFEPDCVVYKASRTNAPMYAVCGRRVPLLLPSWALSADRAALWGGYIRKSTGEELWEMAPIEDVLDAARRQPPFAKNWRSKTQTPLDIEKRMVKKQ